MSEFILMMIVLWALVVTLLVGVMLLNEREMGREFPLSRKREKARMMSEEYRR